MDVLEIWSGFGRELEVVVLLPILCRALEEALLENDFFQINGIGLQSIEDVFVLIYQPGLPRVSFVPFGGWVLVQEVPFGQAFLSLQQNITLRKVPELGYEERVFGIVGGVVLHSNSAFLIGVVPPHDFFSFIQNLLVSVESESNRLLLEEQVVDFFGEVKLELLLVFVSQSFSKMNDQALLAGSPLVWQELPSPFHYYCL